MSKPNKNYDNKDDKPIGWCTSFVCDDYRDRYLASKSKEEIEKNCQECCIDSRYGLGCF